MTAVATIEQRTRTRRFALDAVRLLTIELWLLVLIPDHLVVGALGGIGSPALVVGVGMLLLWGFSALAPGIGVKRSCVPLRVVLGTLWASILVSYALMNVHVVPSDQLLNSDRFLITMAAFTGVAFTAAEGLRNKEEVLQVLRSLVAAVSVMSLIGILQFRPHVDLTKYLAKIPLLTSRGDLSFLQNRGGFTRPASTALHPIEFGVIVAATLAFAIHLAIYDHDRPKWKRWLQLTLIALAIPVSISRSALLVGIIVMAFFFAGTTARLRRRGLLAMLGFVMLMFVVSPGMIGTLKGYVTAGNSDDSISHRTNDYAYAAPYLRHSPWFGRGPGTFLASDFRILDNQYLLSMIEVGAVGAVCLLAVYCAPVMLGRGMRKRSTTESDRNLGQMFAGAGFGALVAAATYDALSFPTFTAVVALTTGLAAASWCIARSNADEPSLRPMADPQRAII
jgi:polysaccharide biosynthesis protein PslJ